MEVYSILFVSRIVRPTRDEVKSRKRERVRVLVPGPLSDFRFGCREIG